MNHEMAKGLGWLIESSKTVFQCDWFSLRQDELFTPSRESLTFSYIDHPGSVFVVPLTIDKKIVLIRSFRYTVDDWCLEIPAGFLGDRGGASPRDIAERELQEEIGGTCSRLESLGDYYLNNGSSNMKGHFFLARDTTFEMRDSAHEAGEIIETIRVISIHDAKRLVANGEINDGDSAFAILLALNHIAMWER